MARPPITVVVCCRNEAERLPTCLDTVATLGAEQVLIVDGGSTDDTVAIAQARGFEVIRSGGKGLAFDRQLGVDAARHDLIAMIDADHRPEPDLLDRLWEDLEGEGYIFVQAGVEIIPNAFWTKAEAQAMATFHHQPGPRAMIGVAPALYRRAAFDHVRFDVGDKEMSDDADFCYRLSQVPGAIFGISHAKVMQEHAPSFGDYVGKFAWYGRRDAAFCRKHPERRASMFFHLLVRYPILRPAKAVASGKFYAPAWFWLAAVVRFAALVKAGPYGRPVSPSAA